MPSASMKAVLIAAATGAMIAAAPAQAGPQRAELLAGQHPGTGYQPATPRDAQRNGYQYHRDHDRSARHRRESRHHDGSDRQHHYANARRYAARAVRQARRARNFGYHADHPRWSLSFRRHFEWALRTSTYKLERESRKRARKLRELQRHADYRHGYGY